MGKRNKQQGIWGSREDREAMESSITSFVKYRDQLIELALIMFDWDFSEIPKEKRKYINTRYIEWNEYFTGLSVFFYDDVLEQYLVLPCAAGGQFDYGDEPTIRTAYSAKGTYHKELTDENSVIIWNNYLRKPSCYTVNHYAHLLSDLEETMVINCKAQKTPVLITCPENKRLTMMQMYNKYSGNAPFIFGEDTLDAGAIKAISTDAPFVATELYKIKTQLWNEALTYLGISNVSFQKKERMLSDEVVRNMGGTIASRYSRIEMRRMACEKIEDIFGIHVEVNFREDYRQTDDEFMVHSKTEEEGDMPTPMVRDYRTRTGVYGE